MSVPETIASARSDNDLTNCDREDIQHIGSIQPVGFLVAVSTDWVIVQISENAPDYLERPVGALLGKSLLEIISIDAAHALRNRMASLRRHDAIERAFGVQLLDGGARFDLAVHKTDGLIVVEGEASEPAGELNAASMVRSMLDRMQGQADFMKEAARLVQALTGFDRVMIYRFHPDDSGEVIAERVRPGLEPYLGLRYPATDIPRQARALLLRNPVRLLYDVAAEPSPIVSATGATGGKLDLSMSVLRSHSKVHIEYLMNMGVRATMTISLLRHGRLWGLISCHHMQPRHIGFERRTTAELFAQMFSFMIESREREELVAYEAHARRLHNELMAAVVGKGSASDNIVELADRLSGIVPCDGIAVCVDGRVTLKGVTPTEDEFRALRQFLDRTGSSQVHASEALSDIYPPAHAFTDRAAGLLMIPISRSSRDYIVFFRQEVGRTVCWAGNPTKLVETGPDGIRLSPRKSFAMWRESVIGHSNPWTEAELRTAEALRVTLIEVVLHLTGLTEKERLAAAQKQELLIAELNHRVRNILGLILGLVAQSRLSAADVETFATVLGDRVNALARAHDQITAKNWEPGPLAKLIATEAGAYLGAGANRVLVAGPPVLLLPAAFSTMALVIHELMTNAAKYGALSGHGGSVAIEWTLDATGAVVLEWNESGGPPLGVPTRRGFGMTIIERSIPYELGGEAVVDYAPLGLRARFSVPSTYVVNGPAIELDLPAEADADSPPVAGRLSGPVLLVEDNMIIALDAEDMLLQLGAASVTVASGVSEALERIDFETPTFALLDVNLGTETSWPVATRLRELGVPHIFATGYGNGIDYPAEHRATPTVTKPYSSDAVALAVGKAFADNVRGVGPSRTTG